MTETWAIQLAHELSAVTLFDEGVEAARNACVAGASIAAAAITAAAWYDNPLTGVPALRDCMELLAALPLELEAWQTALAGRSHPETMDPNYTPGFGFVSELQAKAILESCKRLVAACGFRPEAAHSAYFLRHHQELFSTSGALNHVGLAALLFVDHHVGIEESERRFLVWRIEVAVEQAQLARRKGAKEFPFFSERYVYEGTSPPVRAFDMDELMQRVGLE
ncbi:MAG TPA: hypothetical protein VKP30_10175 [Polyangiaceae bacterium]|nr:hypothetical protein [Polyangiaceae bacterium]